MLNFYFIFNLITYKLDNAENFTMFWMLKPFIYLIEPIIYAQIINFLTKLIMTLGIIIVAKFALISETVEIN